MSHVPVLGFGTRAAACLLGQEPSALTHQETSRPPQASCLGFTLLSFLLWVSKAASRDSQGQRKHMPLSGQTYLPLNSPLRSEVSTTALQRPKKISNSSFIATSSP